MKIGARVLLVFASLLIAYAVTSYAANFTGAPLASGRMEGTPLTPVVILTVFPLTMTLVLVIGNIFINRYFRSRISK